MEAFASGSVIFLLFCVIALILMIVFFPETSNNNSENTKTTTLTPGNVLNDDNDSLTSSGSYDTYNRYGYSNRNTNTNIDESTSLSFLYDLYQQLSFLDRGVSTINGNNSNVTISGANSNVYVNDYLSGASGLSVNSANYYAALAAARRRELVGFSDMDMAAYSPY
jgi:hypothetical protein